MRKVIVFTETIITPLDPERTVRLAEECLLEIRLVESRKESSVWLNEYEVKGDAGRIDKFLGRIKKIENPD